MDSIDQPQEGALAAPGWLVVLGGARAGSRLALKAPLTTLGQAPGCDYQLVVDGVEPCHCALAGGPDGLVLRDLNSRAGTFVNDRRVTSAAVRDGDRLRVGLFEFRIELAADGQRDAVRIQAAAVAAQQAALDEQEARLARLRGEPFDENLEDQRQQLFEWAERIQADRAAVEAAQAEVQRERQQLLAERQRLRRTDGRVRQRWRQLFAAERQRLADESARLADEHRALDAARDEMKREQVRTAEFEVRVGAQLEMDCRHLQDAWERLEEDRRRWRERRTRERQALRVRLQEVERAEGQLAEVRRLVEQDKDAWEAQRRDLERELYGLNNRIAHQRQKLRDQREELTRLEAIGKEHPSQPAPPPAVIPPADGALETLAGELADQRAQLAEQWERLARVHCAWQQQRDEAAGELDALARQFAEREAALARRDQELLADEADLRQRRAELEGARHETLVWRTKLKVQEQAWDGERRQLLHVAQQRQTLADQQLAELGELRQRWDRDRRRETEALRAERAALVLLRDRLAEAHARLKLEVARLEDDRRALTERALAFDVYRREALGAIIDPELEARLDRLRQAWLAQNEAGVLAARRERSALHHELQAVESARVELSRREDELARLRAELEERAVALDHREVLLTARHARLAQDIRQAEDQRALAEQRLVAAQEEAERFARALMHDADPPTLPLGRAA